MRDKKVPSDWPVQPLAPGQDAKVRATCGTCRRSWDDGVSTSVTPTPSGRCPFEPFHVSIDDWIERFEKAGVTDLDDEVHELKSHEASAINNAGLGDQLEYLLEQAGEEYLESLLGEDA